MASAHPVRYWVVTIVTISLIYSLLYFWPLLEGDLSLLRQVQHVDIRGIALQSDLQFQVQEARRKFLHILHAVREPEDLSNQLAQLSQIDSTIQRTEAKIDQLGSWPAENQKNFEANWSQYKAKRDRFLALMQSTQSKTHELTSKQPEGSTGNQDDPAAREKSEADRELGSFLPVEQSLKDAQQSLEAESSSRIAQVSETLNSTLKESFLVLGLRFVALGVLLLIDFRRVRAEKQLAITTRELKLSEERFRQAYESAAVGMGIFKMDGTVVSANRMTGEILGYDPSELIGRKVSEFMAPEYREDHVRRIADLPNSVERSYQIERRVLRKDGTAAWVRNSVTLLKLGGEEDHYFSISEEITLQKEANDRLAFLANYDPVTNLPNRHFFEQHLARELQADRLGNDCVALLYIEVDSFDFLKGTFGRTVADEVLTELGASLASLQREGEIVARLDDYVFGFLVKAAPYDEATMTRGTELRDVFHRASDSGKHRIPLSASIGIAYSNSSSRTDWHPDRSVQRAKSSGIAGPGHDAETLIKFARAAMLEARSRGGDSIFLADPGLQERAAQRHQIESALLRGLREDEFRVVFQPQFEVATGKLVRFEALCRWTSKELGPIPPDRFIPIAEQTGLIMEIGKRVMQEALKQASVWTQSGRRVGVAVNISPMQFMRPDFTEIVTEVLANSKFPPALLELEITEGIFIRDLNLAVARIKELQRLGLSVALDDFGTGYSSLSYLQRMPINAVKLDRSFVSDLTTDPATVSMVRSVLSMASALNLRVVTEGVETEEQLDVLRSLGCDEAQGYLLGRPESSELAQKRVLESPIYALGTVA